MPPTFRRQQEKVVAVMRRTRQRMRSDCSPRAACGKMGMTCSPETRLALRVILPWWRGLSQMTWPSVRWASHFHDGRHTFATLMLELGEAPKVVQSMLGHTKIATTLDI